MRPGPASDEEVKQRQARAMQDPEVQRILTDPVMRQVRSSPAFETNSFRTLGGRTILIIQSIAPRAVHLPPFKTSHQRCVLNIIGATRHQQVVPTPVLSRSRC